MYLLTTELVNPSYQIRHCSDVIMGTVATQITSQPASRLFSQPFIQAQIKENTKVPRNWPFVRGIHRWPVNSPHKGPVTRKLFPFDDVIMGTFSKREMHLSSPLVYSRYIGSMMEKPTFDPGSVIYGFAGETRYFLTGVLTTGNIIHTNG